MEDEILAEELKTYAEKKEELVRQHNGKYVLIKGNGIVGIFDSKEDATIIGIQKFGNTPFLVRKIEEVEQGQNYTSYLIRVGTNAS